MALAWLRADRASLLACLDHAALSGIGTLQRTSGEFAEAEAFHHQSLDLARAIGTAWEEARALAGLGRCAAAVGHTKQARALLQEAYVIFQRIGTADAPAALNALSSPGPRE